MTKAIKDTQFSNPRRTNPIFKIILLLVFAFNISIYANPPTYLYVNLHSHRCGMFSVFNYVAGILYEYEKNQYSGIEVNFEDLGLYYEEGQGLNWWNYYCEPICLGNMENTYVKKFNNDEYNYFAYLTENKLSRQKVFDLIQKYIKIREPIQKKIDLFVQENFAGYHIISVHFRGTDKKLEAPRVEFEEVADAVSDYLQKNKLEKFRIFVASDEQDFIDQMESRFPNRIICYAAKRSKNGKPIHYGNAKNTRRKLGEDALIDAFLLSRGNYLIRTSSNLSLWSTYFNPSMPVLELNQRTKKGGKK